jgi:transposase
MLVSLAHDYGAGGAALFDIVNVQNWTRRLISGPFKHARFRTGSGAALLLSIFKSWLRAISHLTESIWDSQGARTVIHAEGWQRRPACMTKPLSSDLRERLIEAVAAGMSRRAAADRFGIAASTAVKWVRRWRDTGSKAPRPQGGDKRSDRIEAHAEEVLGLVAATRDVTLAEIASHLERRHGERFAQSVVWRLLDRHAMTFKKNRARQRAGPPGRRRAKASLARHTGRA